MPKQTIQDVTRATLKFAAGHETTREQLSSTWYVRFTRGGELYVLNRHAGGNLIHFSFHKDGTFHCKAQDADGARRVVAQWEMPEPMHESGLRRLAAVVIPHRGLVLPANFTTVEDDTVLIPPPGVDEQLEIDIFVEFGKTTNDRWPGQNTEQRTELVGRFSMYADSIDDALLHFTAVTTLRPEGPVARSWAGASINVPEGVEPPKAPRIVLFQQVDVDGQHLPVLTEMPIGHLREDPRAGV